MSINTSQYIVSLSGTINDTFDLMTPTANYDLTLTQTITNGTGENQGNIVYSDSGDISASGSVTIDLISTVTDVYNHQLNMSELKLIEIRNTSDQETGGATSSIIKVETNGIGFLTGTNEYLTIGPGSAFTTSSLVSGWSLSAGSADTITITNQNASAHAAYEIMVMGVQSNESSSSSSFSSESS